MGGRQQGEQAQHGKRNPHIVDGATRSEHGHGQWTCEFDGHGQPQRDGLQRAVEREVHAAERNAANDHGACLVARKAHAPRAPDDAQHDCGESGAQGGGACGANQGEQAFGEGGAVLLGELIDGLEFFEHLDAAGVFVFEIGLQGAEGGF